MLQHPTIGQRVGRLLAAWERYGFASMADGDDPAPQIAASFFARLLAMAVVGLVLGLPIWANRGPATAALLVLAAGAAWGRWQCRRGRHVVAMHAFALLGAGLGLTVLVASMNPAVGTLVLVAILPSYAGVCGRAPALRLAVGFFVLGGLAVAAWNLLPHWPLPVPAVPAAQLFAGLLAMVGVLGPLVDIVARLAARTRELAASERLLEARVAERTAALEASRAQLAQTLFAVDRVGLGVSWNALPDGRFTYANAEIARQLGQAVDALPALGLSDICPELPAAALAGLADELRGGDGHRRLLTHYRRSDGSRYPVEAQLYLHRADGREWFIVFSEDVTEREAAEAALRKAKADAELALQAKTVFLAHMSHDIRTPLTGVIGMAHLMRRGGLTPTQAGQLDKLETASTHLLNIINDILDLTRIESGKLVLDALPVSVEALVANTLSMLEARALAKGLRLVSTVDPLPPGLVGDPTRLQQALLNYAGNAVKFTESGEIALRVRLQAQDAEGALLRFEVQDTGIGIDLQVMPRLFADFEQGDGSTTRRYGGTGLGLAITRHLARMMGGDAGASSRPGVGSTFWFTARLRVDAGRAPPAEAGDPSGQQAELQLRRDHAGARVLVAEDNPVNREVVDALLKAVGLAPDMACDGREAVAMARAGGYRLVLMDMQMPELDGVQATRALRADWPPERLPVVAMTANAFAEDRACCMEAGMNDFVAKPIDPGLLYRVLLRWLRAAPAR